MPAIIKTLARPGIAINGILVALILFLGAMVGTLSMRSGPEPEEMTDMELRAALMSAGLTSGPLTAAGFSAQEAVNIVDAARAHLSSRIQSLRDAHETVQNANLALSALQTQVRHGTAGDNPAALLAAAQETVSNAFAARQVIWDEMFHAATTELELDPAKIQVVEAIRGNGAWKLPTEYLVSARNEPNWLGLRDALDNIRVADHLDQDPDQAAVQFIESVNQEPAVALARINMQNLTAVTEAWEDATFED
jgi:hypothetical protein